MNHFVLAAMCLFLVIVGMVMYYLNTRIKTLESSVAQQNMMLSDVVTSFRKDVVEETTQEVVDDRVYVSDDSEEESDTETEDDEVKDDLSFEPMAGDEQPTVFDEVVASDEQPLVSDEQPLASDEQPLASDEQPLVSDEQPMAGDEQPIYKKMKVDELRKLIQESDLAPIDTIPKMKKQDLIDILSK